MKGSKPFKSTLINSIGSINLELSYSDRYNEKDNIKEQQYVENNENDVKDIEKEDYEDEVDDGNITDNENYIFKANICTLLSRELNLPEMSYNHIGDYEPPKEYGLSNCNAIIPGYYKLHEKPYKIFNMDYFAIIKDDIRNCRILNEYQLKYIKELPEDLKNELFELFNSCIKIFNDIINNT
jgi:hypothetical protein